MDGRTDEVIQSGQSFQILWQLHSFLVSIAEVAVILIADLQQNGEAWWMLCLDLYHDDVDSRVLRFGKLFYYLQDDLCHIF